MTDVELALKGFINELLEQKHIVYHSASNSSYWAVHIDDILELAEKYNIRLKDDEG